MNNEETAIDFTDDMGHDAFSYDGFHVVRGEFFSTVSEPSVTFSGHKLSVNKVCLEKLSGATHIHFLVNSGTRKMIIKPCGEDEKDSLLWRRLKDNKSEPRRISCKLFFDKLAELMNWDKNLRYKLLGKLVEKKENKLFYST